MLTINFVNFPLFEMGYQGLIFLKSIIITSMKYEKLILDENTKFNDAIINDPNFIDHISKQIKYL